MVKRGQLLGSRILMLTLVGILITSAVVGSVGVYAIKREGDQDSSRQLNLLCSGKSKSINEFLMSVEQSAGIVARYAAEDLDSAALMAGGVIGADGLPGDYTPHPQSEAAAEAMQAHLKEHIERVQKVFTSSANHTHGIFDYYYRINPQLSDENRGFWFTKGGQNTFSAQELSPLELVPGEEEQAQWYYAPLLNGRHIWLEPYYNEELGAEIVSYIIPVYKAGTFIGLVGIDIRFETITELVADISVFDSGYAYLAMRSGELVFNPRVDLSAMTSADPSLGPVTRYFQEMDSTQESTILYTYRGEEKEMAFRTLANGMLLVIAAPTDELNAGWHDLVWMYVIIGISAMGLFGAAMFFTLRRLIDPLRRLTEASRRIAEGDYSVELNYMSSDEIGVLTEAFRKLSSSLQVYIKDLNSLAYRDALTRVRNKTAFDMTVKELDEDILQQKIEPFALVMLDCDDLKLINDRFGHVKGNIYLQNASKLICKIFAHCPVFRVGGDEFIALVRGDELEKLPALMAAFDEQAETFNGEVTNPWEKVHVSMGEARYDPAVDTNAEDVFNRADGAMYVNKIRRKAQYELL